MSIAHIAKLAGVSTATVSRVLADSPLVREQTADQVRTIIKQVGYVPPPPPRLRRKRRRRRGSQSGSPQDLAGRNIALITLGQNYRIWFTVPAISMFVAAATSEARAAEANLLLDEMPDPAHPCLLIERGDVDGAILLVDSEFARTRAGIEMIQQIARKSPAVWALGGHLGPTPIDHVSPDNLGIGHIALRHLLDKGCRNVAFVTDQPHWPFGQLRATAFINAGEYAHIHVTSYLVGNQPDVARMFPGRVRILPSFNDIAEAMAQQNPRPDGVFLPRDFEAAHFYPCLRRAGFQPQHDIAVIACDNDRRQLSTLNPMPATIDVNPHEIARLTLRCLRRRMRHRNEPPILIHVPPTLIEPPARGQENA